MYNWNIQGEKGSGIAFSFRLFVFVNRDEGKIQKAQKAKKQHIGERKPIKYKLKIQSGCELMKGEG